MRNGARRAALLSVALAVALLALPATGLLLGGCGKEEAASKSRGKTGNRMLTDLAGRAVDIEVPVDRVVAIGPGALRLVCYAGAAAKVVGIENFERQSHLGRPYILAHPGLLKLPVVGQGGPDSTPDPEILLEVEPDVIFVAYLADRTKADELQSRTGIPVVVLSYGQLGTFDEQLTESIRLVGEITGDGQRTDALVAYIARCRDDLFNRTASIAETNKPSVYVGGLGMKGTHGIESTSGAYPPLTAINAKNLVDETGSKGSVMIDKEKLVSWDPDIIFIDEAALAMVKEDYAKNPGFYKSLTAFGDGAVFGFLPYNYYTTNIDTALADAYFMGKTVYPEAFADIDPADKADEIYSFLLGQPLYEQMAKDFGGFMQIDTASF